MRWEGFIAFLIRMEGGRGVLGKNPEYIMEKWQQCKDENYDLDAENQRKFCTWLTRFGSLELDKSEVNL